MELSDNATHDEIQTYVDEVIASRAGEAKTDGQQLASETDTTEGTREEETREVEETKETPEETLTSWLDEDVKKEATAYGIGEEELAEFTSREELDRALRLLDRKALEAGRDKIGRDEQGRFTKQEKSREEKSPEVPNGKFEITLSKDVYDDGLVDQLTQMRDFYEARIAAVESRFAELDAQAEEQQFDALVDSLGHADLFGKTGKESPKEMERRQALYLEWKTHLEGLASLGRTVDPDALLSRVAKMTFPQELEKKLLKSQTRKISQQSNSRQGGGATRPTDAPETLKQEMRRLYEELERASP